MASGGQCVSTPSQGQRLMWPADNSASTPAVRLVQSHHSGKITCFFSGKITSLPSGKITLFVFPRVR